MILVGYRSPSNRAIYFVQALMTLKAMESASIDPR